MGVEAGCPGGCEWSCGDGGGKGGDCGLCRGGGDVAGGSVCADELLLEARSGSGLWMRPGGGSRGGSEVVRLGREAAVGLGVQAESRLLGVKSVWGGLQCVFEQTV